MEKEKDKVILRERENEIDLEDERGCDPQKNLSSKRIFSLRFLLADKMYLTVRRALFLSSESRSMRPKMLAKPDNFFSDFLIKFVFFDNYFEKFPL